MWRSAASAEASYIVRAANRRGSRVLLVVDGRTTEITGLRVTETRHQGSFDDGGWNCPASVEWSALVAVRSVQRDSG